MAERKPAKQGTQKSAKSATKKATKKSSKTYKGFSDEERAAMKERAKELKAEARADKNKAEGKRDVLAKIAEIPEPDRAMASGSMLSLEPARQPSRRGSGMG